MVRVILVKFVLLAVKHGSFKNGSVDRGMTRNQGSSAVAHFPSKISLAFSAAEFLALK